MNIKQVFITGILIALSIVSNAGPCYDVHVYRHHHHHTADCIASAIGGFIAGSLISRPTYVAAPSYSYPITYEVPAIREYRPVYTYVPPVRPIYNYCPTYIVPRPYVRYPRCTWRSPRYWRPTRCRCCSRYHNRYRYHYRCPCR